MRSNDLHNLTRKSSCMNARSIPPAAQGGEVPHPVMVGGAGTPSSHGQRGTPGTPPTIQTWDGVPPPTIRPGMGYPRTIRPGMGYPPHNPDLGQGTPPPSMVNRQTFPSITFPRTTYAGGKNCKWLTCNSHRGPSVAKHNLFCSSKQDLS